MFRLRTFFILLIYLLPISYGQANESKVALVIGNAAYLNAPLKNPGNDASDVAAKLRGLGCDVIERNNIKMRQIGSILHEFRSKLSPGAVALVFYAGHGIPINGENYLPAVDADINVEDEVPNQSLAISQIMDVLKDSKTRLNLFFLDACRNNPYFHSFRSAERGLARITAPSGTLISYATHPGSVAIDGQGRNGLYTSKLLQQMDSNLPIELSLKAVAREVKAASDGKQEPWMEGSLEGDFCFVTCGNLEIQPDPLKPPVQVPSNPRQPNESIAPTIPAQPVIEPPKPPVPPPPKPDPAAMGKLFWERIKNSFNPDDFNNYLKQCRAGRFPCDYGADANSKLQSLLRPTPPPSTSVQSNPIEEPSNILNKLITPPVPPPPKPIPKPKSETQQSIDRMSSTDDEGNFNPILPTAVMIYAPFTISANITESTKKQPSTAMTDPTSFGNPDSMIAKAMRLQIEREKKSGLVDIAKR